MTARFYLLLVARIRDYGHKQQSALAAYGSAACPAHVVTQQHRPRHFEEQDIPPCIAATLYPILQVNNKDNHKHDGIVETARLLLPRPSNHPTLPSLATPTCERIADEEKTIALHAFDRGADQLDKNRERLGSLVIRSKLRKRTTPPPI